MHRIERLAWLAAVITILTVSTAMGAPEWTAIGEFQAGGDGKAAAYSGEVSACRLVCTEGSIIVNTFIVIEGRKRTPIKVGVRIPAGQMHEIMLPDAPRTVTGFRISDTARGKYRLEVLQPGADQDADTVATDNEATTANESRKTTPASPAAGEAVTAAEPASQAPVESPQQVKIGPTSVEIPALPPSTHPPAEPSDGTTGGNNSEPSQLEMPWEVK